MRKSLDSHYVNNLLQRDWYFNPKKYWSMNHSINEKDITKVETTDYGNYVQYTIYCNLVAGSNNFYDYIVENWGNVWEGTDVRIKIVPTLPKAPYFDIRMDNPDGDDILGDYDYRLTIDFPYGPYITCWDDDGASFEPKPFYSIYHSISFMNFHGIWIINPGEF